MKLKQVALAAAAVILVTAAAASAYAWHEGSRVYVVKTGSMVPTFHPGDAVLDQPATGRYSVGVPVTVEIGADQLVSHRLIKIDKQGMLHTKGDANPKADVWALPPTRVRGVVDHVLPKMGYVLVFLRQRAGVAGVMTSALSLILLWGLCFPTEAEPAPAREAKRDRRRILIRVPRQRTATQASVASVPFYRMPPTPPPVRRMPPTPPPVVMGAELVRLHVVPRPRVSADS